MKLVGSLNGFNSAPRLLQRLVRPPAHLTQSHTLEHGTDARCNIASSDPRRNDDDDNDGLLGLRLRKPPGTHDRSNGSRSSPPSGIAQHRYEGGPERARHLDAGLEKEGRHDGWQSQHQYRPDPQTSSWDCHPESAFW
jgi:hypothetical protein